MVKNKANFYNYTKILSYLFYNLERTFSEFCIIFIGLFNYKNNILLYFVYYIY